MTMNFGTADTVANYPIRTDVPIPEKKAPNFPKSGAGSIYPWRRLQVGHSFLVLPKHQNHSHAVRSAALEKGKQMGRVFSVRTDERGRLGVWRTK